MSLLTENWLMDNTAKRCVLAKVQVYDVVGGSDIYLYLSTTGYAAGSTSYQPIISGGLQFSESITINGSTSVSYGDLEINNPNGEFDAWLDDSQYIWVNRTIQLYYGDPLWVATDTNDVANNIFELIFDGLIVDIDSKSRTKLNIKVRDKMERLNTPVTEANLGASGSWGTNAQPNKDAVKPLVFGEVHNMTPLQTDPSTLEYMANSGPAELILEVRDNGVPIHTSGGITGITSYIGTTGKFTLNTPPAGVITISVQGVNNSINLGTGALVTGTYVNTITNLIALIATQYGRASTKLSATDLDLTNLSSFDSSNAIPAGIIVNDSSTVRTICGLLAESIGAQLFFSRIGKLQILRIGNGFANSAITTITDIDIISNTLQVQEKIPVIAAAKIAYCKNWTVQRDLMTGIPDSHKVMFSEEWMTITSTTDYSAVAAKYKIDQEPEQKNTYLITTTDGTNEANRLAGLYSTARTLYTFTGTPRLLQLQLGQNINITHNRFGLSGGKNGQIVTLGPNWTTGLVNVGVLV